MTKEQILNTLPTHEDEVMGEKVVYAELYDCYCTTESFLSMFGEFELTYNSLLTNPNLSNGWKKQFNAWHEQGII